ncbi:hypothetical protein ACFVAJ_17030 [Agromyces sp. NPDC057679]|uniref:hypothetical protein n=1 Tax=Agromyces sp. NPDC057679 TaxID=3346207 RepID=UPI00366FD9FA
MTKTDVADRTRHLDGRFASEHHTPAEPIGNSLELDPVTGKVLVPTVFQRAAVTPGVLDDNAEFAFKNGHCVAFAYAVARHFGLGGVTVYFRADDQSIIHAFASDGRRFFDVDGEVDIVEWERHQFEYDVDEFEFDEYDDDNNDEEADPNWDVAELDDAEAFSINDSEWSNGLPAQNYALAETMMVAYEARLEENRERLAALNDRRRPAAA